MKKIVIHQNVPEMLEPVQNAAPDYEVVLAKDLDTVKKLLPETEILVTWSAKAVVESLCGASLRWIQMLSAGVDALPLDALKEKGIILTTASGIHPNQITESVFSMMLAFARGLPTAIRDQKEHLWRREYALTEIHEKTLGILGVGDIGLEIARIAAAFHMRVLGLRRSGSAAPNVEIMFPPDQIDDMLAECDYVVNVLPHTAATHRLMNRERFAAIKPGCVYINAGRGATTDQDALLEALRTGVVAAAGLDVTDPEPLPPESPLWSMENVLITPHIAGQSDQYFPRAFAVFTENLKAYRTAGAPIKNVVDYDLQY